MPYLGYFEADIQLGKEIIVGRGILVLAADRDPPMLVGLNVIKDMDPAYLVQELGLSTDTPKAKPQPNIQGLVRVCGTRVIVPPESVKVISVSCPFVHGSEEVVVEPLTQLPKGIFVGSTLNRTGRKLNLQVLNLTKENVVLQPRTPLGKLEVPSVIHDDSLSVTKVAMAETDRHKTGFITPFGLYEFNRMPFGLSNAPGTFQRLMQTCLHDQFFQSVLCYLDDILVYSKTFEDHLTNLQRVFDRLKQQGLKIKPSKCTFFQSEVTYLGHKVTRAGVMPSPDKIQAVKDWPAPRNVKELRSFLGFCSFYRRFVYNFSQTAKPLHTLVSTCLHQQKSTKTVPFTWSDEHQEAFKILKQKLCENVVLAYPN
ncbi:hypothetical protein BSL78_00255 [Apostichopus japonicus]|uniref:Reverse transcriptase domain-containing protein n=1 Tax=Stichopus japonicus TaxID=307972 RepID=A0A2G8LRF8_STIJA|nr:hypothetical protein BSL78_00255 [Apostichopus japonicus]